MLKKTLKKIWFPVVVVLAAAMQTFGMDVARTGGFSLFSPSESSLTDTVIYDNSRVFTKFRKVGEKIAASDSLGADDTLSVDDTMPVLTARDTIHAPDSLRETDPFRYRYYVALVDSLTHKQVRDSLIAAGDSLDWPRIDSIYFADSARRAKEAFEAWYNGLDKAARKQYDYKQKMKRKMRQMDSTLAIKDSLKAIKDSIAENTPRILETYAIPEDYWYRRIFAWHRDQDFSEPAPYQPDTSYNYWFNDYPFMRQDVNVSYLGVAGSAVQPYDFFKRTSENGVSFYTPYEVYSYSPATLPMYNTKTPYTELAYWGTLFANESNEEADIKVMTTQNIFPSLNLTLGYERTGSHGMILREKTENRTAYAYANYLGKKYLAHGGFIYNRVTAYDVEIRAERTGIRFAGTLKINICSTHANIVLIRDRIIRTFLKLHTVISQRERNGNKVTGIHLISDITDGDLGYIRGGLGFSLGCRRCSSRNGSALCRSGCCRLIVFS